MCLSVTITQTSNGTRDNPGNGSEENTRTTQTDIKHGMVKTLRVGAIFTLNWKMQYVQDGLQT